MTFDITIFNTFITLTIIILNIVLFYKQYKINNIIKELTIDFNVLGLKFENYKKEQLEQEESKKSKPHNSILDSIKTLKH